MLGQSAQAALDIVITGGIDSARPIAIAPFKWEGNGQLPQDIAEVVSNDLMRSGKFKPLARGQMPQAPSSSGEINFAPWASQGVEAVVVGSIAAVGDGTYKINFELVDVLKGQLAKTRAVRRTVTSWTAAWRPSRCADAPVCPPHLRHRLRASDR